MFARRTRWDLRPNALALKSAELKARGVPFLDLTESNPTDVELSYPQELVAALADPHNLVYEPDPKGLLPARESVARLFARKGAPLTPDRIVLTSSTSEAYQFLFRLLADPGDRILVPRPSYPLFDYLAELNDL